MGTLFANSPDGMQVAYDCAGSGPAIILLHGGGGWRQEWHETGYVSRLQEAFTVITLDLRGHGESSLPIDSASYTPEKMGQDILAVADACAVGHFFLWGMSYGGKVGRYLATQSERVDKAILMSAHLGPGAPGQMRQDILDFCAHWPPILQAQSDGVLNLASLPQEEKDFLGQFNVPVMLAWGQAMLDWPAIKPADFLCPVLWMVGSEDQQAMDSIREYERVLTGSRVQTYIAEGKTHEQVFEDIDEALPIVLAFIQSEL